MSHYRGRALNAAPRRTAAGASPWRQPLRILAVMLALGALAMVPWGALRRRFAVVADVHVTGLKYLDAARIRHRAGLAEGQDLLSLDFDRARQMLLLDPRVLDAAVHRRGLRGVQIDVTERTPVLAVIHGEPWELDTAGVLLEPLQAGVVADVPMLTGPDVSTYRPGTQIKTVEVQRGLAWRAALSDNALRLAGQVSEVDVSESRLTRLVLMDGVRVVAPAWPPGARQLSGLRATLADLEHRGVTPREVDVRFPDQVIVRGESPAHGAPSAEEPHRS